MKVLLQEGKTQYKANLHCHSCHSDGKLTPEEIKRIYLEKGYSILAITDHEHLLEHNDLSDERMLFLTAYEVYVRTMPFDFKRGSQSHFNLYSKTPRNKMVYYTPNHTRYIPQEELENLQYYKYVERRENTVEFIQEMIAYAKECGYLVCHNHPTWSFESESSEAAYDGCFAMEIYNHGAYQEGHFEYNQHYYERQLRRGLRMGLIAADDNHNHFELEDPASDSFGGITYVLADQLEYASVIEALEKRNFYASTGPQIFSFTSDNGLLTVKTSDAQGIWFVTNSKRRKAFWARSDQALTSAVWEMSPEDDWIRIEVIDKQGKRAFTRAYEKEEIFE